ncbi:MAG: prepilin peptidase [Pseudomonadota bacterium]
MGWGLISFGLVATLGALLLAAGIEDARTREISNRKTAAIALLAPVFWWVSGLAMWPGIAVQLGIAALVFALFVGAFALGQMGGGDVKLIGALALWLPFAQLAWALIVMALIGGAITALFLVERWWRHRDARAIEIPYGVAIAIAGLIQLREPILNQIT